MNAVNIGGYVDDWKQAQTTNSTATSFSALLATLTKPSASATRSIIERKKGATELNTLRVMPFGGSSDNETVITKVTGWNFVKGDGTRGMWVPQFVCEVLATLSSTLVGLANEAVIATEFFADTLSLTAGIAVLTQGTGDLDAAYFDVDISSYELVEITYDLGSADTQNALYKLLT